MGLIDVLKKCMNKLEEWYIGAVFVFLLDLVDFVTDWLFFVDVILYEKGLVYGPPDTVVIGFILLFCVVGTVLFLAETVNLYFEERNIRPRFDSDNLAAVVVWCEDIPQVAISLYLVLCREEAISVFQLMKAAVVLIGTFIRLVQVGLKYFSTMQWKERSHMCVKVIVFTGMLVQAGCSVAITFLAQTTSNGAGISFQVPTTLIDETFSHRHYLANVSVFVAHSHFFDVDELQSPQEGGENAPGMFVGNWMRLASVDHVMAKGKGEGLQFSLEYEVDSLAKILKLALWEKEQDNIKQDVTISAKERWTLSGCYIVNQTRGTVSDVTRFEYCTAASGFFTSNSRNAFMTFGFKAPGTFFRRQIFGDITFNMRLSRTCGGERSCSEVRNYTSSQESAARSLIPLRFHYFRTAADLPRQGTSHFLLENIGKSNSYSEQGDIRFFRNNGQDLTEIDQVWKTGWLGCDSTGNLAPTLNSDLKVDFSRET